MFTIVFGLRNFPSELNAMRLTIQAPRFQFAFSSVELGKLLMKHAPGIPFGNGRHDLHHSARIALACLDLTGLNDAGTEADMAQLCLCAQGQFGQLALFGLARVPQVRGLCGR